MDRILSYLPDNVHVRFGWDSEPWCGSHSFDHVTYQTICIPKSWLKHGDRGAYDEWSIKETYKKKLAKEFGEEFLHTTEQLEVLEWNQLENIAYNWCKAEAIGFTNILEKAKEVARFDIRYTHSVAI